MALEYVQNIRDAIDYACPRQPGIHIDQTAEVDDHQQRHHCEQAHRHVGDVHLLGEREDHEREQEQIVLHIARKDEHYRHR